MSATTPMPTSDHVVGEPHPNTQGYATFETKPTTYIEGRKDTGGGYEHWRSTEWRPHTARQDKEDVYVSHHRLLAVVACYDHDTPIDEVLADLRGKDVHHESGFKFDNRPSNLEVVDHGDHAAITQAEMRAWGADAKRAVEAETGTATPTATATASTGVTGTSETRCVRCDDVAETVATAPSLDGPHCIACAMDVAPAGETIDVGGGD